MDDQINSQEYWNNRFKSDWDNSNGPTQSTFFMDLMVSRLPRWMIGVLNAGNIKVCDWGCAEGDGTSVFANKFPKTEFIGIDFARTAIDKARENYNLNNLDFIATDLLGGGDQDVGFDLLLASNIFEHFEHPWDVFDRVSRYSKSAMVVMVPFKEDPQELHFEHFYSFEEKDFLLQRDEWLLAHFEVIDTGALENTAWQGQQALAIYVKRGSSLAADLGVHNTLIQSERSGSVDLLAAKLALSVEDLTKANTALSAEKEKLTQELNAVTSSRRYRLANQAAEVRHKTRSLARGVRQRVRRNLSTSRDYGRLDSTKKAIEKSGLFDADYYLKTYPDISDSGVDPLEHFIAFGGRELRNPSEGFDSAYYARMNGLDAGNDVGVNPLIHHISQKGNRLTDLYSVKNREAYEDRIIQDIVENGRQYTVMVVIESMSWSGSLQQRPHHLARLLAERGVLVVYVDSGAHKSSLVQEVLPNLFLMNDKSAIERLAASSISTKYYWLFSTTPKETDALRAMVQSGYTLIYDYIDDFAEAISGDIRVQLKNFEILEELNVGIYIASAKNLHQQLQEKFPNQHILLCQNAVDMTHFDSERIKKDPTVPADMKRIVQEGKPIVGYYGAIAPWLDYDLINNTTERRSDLNFVFLGIDYNGGLDKLTIRDNVHFLGSKDYFLLQDYAKLFDCAIIPFEKGDIAKSTSPVKLFEYMAMGLPTICTSDLRECEGYEYVYMSQTEDDFIDNIDKAIKNKTSKAKKILVNQAKSNTWDARVDDIYKRMKEVAKKEH